MARTIQEIKNEMTGAFMANANVRDKYKIIDPNATFEQAFSAVSLENLFFYIVAFGQWLLEQLFDLHKNEVSDYILRMKPHSAAWYVTKAKAFQYGYSLLPDSDLFNNGSHTEDEIEASKIVKYAAAIERQNRLLLKAAKVEGDDLAELTAPELTAFTAYIDRIRDAGVIVEILSAPADKLQLHLKIYYNSLLMNKNGELISNGTTPVPDAIRAYLANIEFDGVFVKEYLTDALQRVQGVEIPHIVSAGYKYGALTEWLPIEVKQRAISGWFRVDDADLHITYISE
jgi:hypothetical protein